MNVNRRTLLKGILVSLGSVLGSRLRFLFPEAHAGDFTKVYLPLIAGSLQVLNDFEEYAGFIIVPLGAEIPSIANSLNLQPPTVCGVAGGIENINGETILLETPANLNDFVEFPVYGLEDLPTGISYLSSSALKYLDSDDVYSTMVTYVAESSLGVKVSPISIDARRSFATPVPVYRSDALFDGEPYVEVVAYDSLPRPGVRYNGINSFIFQWIEDDVLYTLRQETTLLSIPVDFSTIAGNLVKHSS